MTEEPEASVLTARRATQHFRLSSSDDAYEHLYILIVRSSLGPSPPNAGRYTVASRFRCRSCERGYIFPRAPEQFVTSPLCLVGYVRWDARSDRVPPLQTIIFSSFTGRTPVRRLIRHVGPRGSFQNDRGTFFPLRTNTVPAGRRNAIFFLELSTDSASKGAWSPTGSNVRFVVAIDPTRFCSKFVHAFAREAFVLLFRQTTL